MRKRTGKQRQKINDRREAKGRQRKVVSKMASVLSRRGAKVVSLNKGRQPSVVLLGVDNNIVIPECNSVGNCCKDRPIFLEPSDVFRIVNNERVRGTFGIQSTMDLYPEIREGEVFDEELHDEERHKRHEEGEVEKRPKNLLMYGVDYKAFIPHCFIQRRSMMEVFSLCTKEHGGEVEPDLKIGVKDEICPFLEFGPNGESDCILGDDRPIQCSTDPVYRYEKMPDGLRSAGWQYVQASETCLGCFKNDGQSMIKTTVGRLLKERKTRDKYVDSDLFHDFVRWLRETVMQLQDPQDKKYLLKLGSIIVFDWHRFSVHILKQSIDEASREGPSSAQELVSFARMSVQAAITRGAWNGDKDDQAKGESPAG